MAIDLDENLETLLHKAGQIKQPQTLEFVWRGSSPPDIIKKIEHDLAQHIQAQRDYPISADLQEKLMKVVQLAIENAGRHGN